MKTKMNVRRAFYALTASFMLASCQKSELNETTAPTNETTIAVAAVAPTTISGTTAGTDSVYLVQACRRGEQRETIAESALPASVSSYIAANYSGATFHKAFAVKDAASVTTGFVVVLYYNDKPVGLKFDSAGSFVKVLEQRERGDLNGMGHHHGGRFEHRDGKQRDTIALNALPAAITGYFNANYATDTLVKAFRTKDNSVVVLSKNGGVFATVFNSANSFVKREQLPSKGGRHESIELAQVPAVAANYLAQTYPNYVFTRAFSFSQNSTVQGYVVVIDANNTKYAVEFDATGNFVKAKTIR
jgi:hypothetical protein